MLPSSEHLLRMKFSPLLEADVADSGFVARVVAAVDFTLPADYLSFLSDFPRTGIFDVEIACLGLDAAPCAPDRLYPVTLLYGQSSEKSNDLLSIREIDWELPAHYLVIGDDIGGNLFCLDMRPSSLGEIFFHFDEEPVASGMYRIAKNFTDFIFSLRPY